MTGYKDINGNIITQIGTYFVSKENLGIGQKVGEYTDFSFLRKENFDEFISWFVKLSATVHHIKLHKETSNLNTFLVDN